MENSNQIDQNGMFIVGLILMGIGVLLSTILSFFYPTSMPAFLIALSLILFSKKPTKDRALRMVAIILTFWLPLSGCTKVSPSSDTNHDGVAENVGSDSLRGTSVTEPVRADAPSDDSRAIEARVEWKTFRGENFDVQYPGSFTVESSGEKDGILFAAPDRSVQFYVFSPLWNGESEQYETDPDNELVKQHSVEREASRRITRITYQRRDNHYMRSFEDVEDTVNNTRRIFGIFYTNQSAYSEYKDLYLTFKKSLKQYADH